MAQTSSRAVSDTSGRFVLDTFEQLDSEYSARPLRAAPVPRAQQDFREKAAHRVGTIQRQIGRQFIDSVVLELGCGHGWLTAYLPEVAGAAQAIGIDPVRYPTWAEHSDRRVRLIEGDLASSPLVDAASVDFVVSGAVFEHVTRPVEMIAALFESLRPGGRAWLYFNLYRGPQASHRYNEISFPWPHLLFDDQTCAEFYVKRTGRQNVSFAWVNRMTIADYVMAVVDAGFDVVTLTRRVVPIDVGFYLRFEETLGKYPALDLETDFATLVLEKPFPRPSMTLRPSPPATRLPYAERQVELREAIRTRQDDSE
jgi:SAM-dependent methyltransferase